MSEIKAVCFGEVLMDVFPSGERIGGAPLNVASRLSSLGLKTQLISKVGEDSRGKKIISYLENNQVGTQNIIRDKNFSTGVVNVSLSASGSATYEIAYPSAWDKIEVSKNCLDAVEESSVFVFGSLVCRDEVSKNTLLELLPRARFKVLDFNLRPPHYTKELLLELIQKADFIKFNDDELFEISAILGSSYNSMEQNIEFISQTTGAKSICVTKGKHGAVFFHDKTWYYNSGYKIEVKDTVGAGDSFLATLIASLLKEIPVQEALDKACAIGALVASKEGANPKLDPKEMDRFMCPQ